MTWFVERVRSNLLYLFDLDLCDTEKALWVKHHISKAIFNIRLCYALGIILYALFAILDVYMAPITYKSIWLIRFLIVIPVMAGLLTFSHSKLFIRFNQTVTTIFVLVAGGGINLMIAATEKSEPAHQYYYAGLILVLVAQNSLTHLKAELGFICSLILIASYDYTIGIGTSPQDLAVLLNNNFFLMSAGILGYLGARSIEKLFKRDYFQTQKVIEANLKLDELNNVKTKILSILSHDLRGPIANVKSLISLLANKFLSREEFQEKLDSLLSLVNGANVLLDNLLSWSSSQFHSGKLFKKKVSLRLLTNNVFEVMRPIALQKGIYLVNAIDETILISVEPSLLETVIRNLVSNAIKFTEKGQIKVSAVNKKSEVQVQIEDTGVGMEESVANSLFKWENRSSSRGTQNERGSGIGLLISKELVELHEGNISVQSRPGKGTIFSFTIGLN